MKNIRIETRYEWYTFFVGSATALFFLIASSNLVLRILAFLVILILVFYESFRKAIIKDESIWYITPYKKIELHWEAVKKVQLSGGIKRSLHIVFFMENGKKYVVFPYMKDVSSFKELCIQKKVSYSNTTAPKVYDGESNGRWQSN
jgi:hypothetical protein